MSIADTVPQCGPICFHSSDPSLVSVVLAHELQPDRRAHLNIPRSAIIFISDYKTSQYREVPDEVISDGRFNFAIVMPDGKPLGEVVEQYAKSRAVSLDAAITALRPQYAKVGVRLIGKDIGTSRLYSAWMPRESEGVRIKEAPPFDGLPAQTTEFQALKPDGSRDSALSDSHYIVYYPKDNSDPFTLIRCEQNSPPDYWCHYLLRLNDLISLEVDMVDFRFHGGRQFVRERMDVIIQAYCRYDQTCDR